MIKLLVRSLRRSLWIPLIGAIACSGPQGSMEDLLDGPQLRSRSGDPGVGVEVRPEQEQGEVVERREEREEEPLRRRAELVLPAVVALPYVQAGGGKVSTRIELINTGDASALAPDGGPLRFVLVGDPSLSLCGAPAAVPPGERAFLEIVFSGLAEEGVASANLRVAVGEGSLETTVHAVAGDPDLGPAVFAPVLTPAGGHCGEGATVQMPAAPYPHPEGYFSDPSVRIFLPEGYRDLAEQDLVFHFHGHSTTLSETLSYHRYQEHLYASGANVILVVPQGPVEKASGDFGKLMDEGGLARLAREVLIFLYREGRIQRPLVGEVMLTAHSGGFRGVASNLTQFQPFVISLVGLFDALYADTSTFVSYSGPGGRLRSSFTRYGGTTEQNRLLAKRLSALGVEVKDELTQRRLAGDEVIAAFSDTSHSDVTRLDGAYGELLRFAAPRSRLGPRIELRSAVVSEGDARLAWLAPPDRDATGIRVELSDDGASWRTVDEAGLDAGESRFPLSGGGFVRVSGIMPYTATPLVSDVYRVDEDAEVLVVDGFDRILDGAWSGLWHEFAARVGEATGPVHTVSHRAILEDGFDPKSYPVLLWLLGDESRMDISLHPEERAAISAYLQAGGRLIASGSDLAYDLDKSDPRFMESVFGASFLRDDARSNKVKGVGPLAHLGAITLGGPGAPYAGFRPDTLEPEPDGEVLLRYGTGQAAAVGLEKRAVILGFSLEQVGSDAELAALVAALLQWLR
ncbi:MAG: hypothetical protein RBU30_01185 [Polyangia bacterium]|nr:hypothetical protein [Polyangia bacterium]